MITEANIAADVRVWLDELGLDVAQEVAIDRAARADHPDVGDSRVDLTGRSDEEFAVVECKLSLSVELMFQAAKWRRYANRVWIAVLWAPPSELREERVRIARKFYGLGVVEVRESVVSVRCMPRWMATFDHALLKSIRPEHKVFAPAGAPGGRCFTPTHGTEAALAAFVAAHKGTKLDEAVKAIKHHYRSNAAAEKVLKKSIKDGMVPGVVFGWRQGLYSSAEEAGKRT